MTLQYIACASKVQIKSTGKNKFSVRAHSSMKRSANSLQM